MKRKDKEDYYKIGKAFSDFVKNKLSENNNLKQIEEDIKVLKNEVKVMEKDIDAKIKTNQFINEEISKLLVSLVKITKDAENGNG